MQEHGDINASCLRDQQGDIVVLFLRARVVNSWNKLRTQTLEARIFFVFPLGAYTNKSEGFSNSEQSTYSCPCEKHGFSQLSPHTCSDCPCALLMVIAKASLTGNCRCLNSNGISVVIIRMHGNRKSSPLNLPFKMVAYDIVHHPFN